MLLDEKTFFIDPFCLKKFTDEVISEQINVLATKYKNGDESLRGIVSNIEIYANILYLYGEMVARLTERHQILKLNNEKGLVLETYKLRSTWLKNTPDKAPNISYFEAQATEKFENDKLREFSVLADLTRYKKAYESVENKMNALKKKLDIEKTHWERNIN